MKTENDIDDSNDMKLEMEINERLQNLIDQKKTQSKALKKILNALTKIENAKNNNNK